ncbi:MarR family winged helix-turn-helix transcriptional regulator [Bauldia sp.]|uniref:MarR family winged helix-turn-helix transcriptional regulator n=1 Tax=Bauldia sp. TaxID=2575872 RepID=UPI003BAA04C9
MPDTEIGQLVDRFMRRIHCDLGRRAPSFDPERVGPAGGLVLMTLADLEPVPMHELVRSIARDKAQITRLLQSLGKKGLVERSPSPVDGRVCVIQLSQKGHETVARLRQALAETIDGLLAPLSAQERQTLKSLLKKAFEV